MCSEAVASEQVGWKMNEMKITPTTKGEPQDGLFGRRRMLSATASALVVGSAVGASGFQPSSVPVGEDKKAWLFTFEELCTNPSTNGFAYWVLVEREQLDESITTLDSLYYWMVHHYDVEEQASGPQSFKTSEQFTAERMRIISPVTLAHRWSPFSFASQLLGAPLRSERGPQSNARAFAVWKPKAIHEGLPADLNEHERHCAFLLGLACSIALKEEGRIFIVGSPGWSYEHWRSGSRMMNPEIAMLMHQNGYVYTDRVSQ